MKILFCASDRPGHLATGPNAWIQRLVPDLIHQYGLNIHTLFFYSGDIENCPTISFFKNQQLPLSTINKKNLYYVEDQVKALLQVVKEKSVSIVVANLVIPAFYATPYLKKTGIPVIGVMHSNDQFYKGVIQKFIHGIKPNQLSASVAVSECINQLCQNKSSSTQLQVIPCGTPLPNKTLESPTSKQLKVMYAGRIVVEQKQILKLTKSFIATSSCLPSLSFSIYGDGNEVDNVKQLLATPSPHRVNYKGAIAPSEMLEQFAQHHIFTLMSDYEGMPVSLMEAMACGLVPVCLKEKSGIDEIIEHGVNGFTVNNRQEDYLAKLKLLSEDEELWKSMSQNAIKTIKNNYSSKITHHKWADLLLGYKDFQPKKITIPRWVKLKGELLHYGDHRKPSLKAQLNKKIKQQWLNLRLFLRPRARLREVFNK